MSKTKILFFAADPLSAQPDASDVRLLLDEDVRQIKAKVRAAGERAELFDWRLAARPDDLLDALNQTRPRVVHFSGHGVREGLVLVGPDGRPHLVPAKGLTELFEAYRGRIRLVVLNACFSHEQAKAIAEVVGCAIGTRRAISDPGAITFGAELYRALVSGQSVKTAFDRANVALAVKHPHDAGCPQLEVRDDVDPTRLFVFRPRLRAAATRAAGFALAIATLVAVVQIDHRPEPPAEQPDCGWDEDGSPRTLAGGLDMPPPTPGAPSARADLGAAKSLYRNRRYAQALPLFRRAAEAGNAEAMALLGVAFMHGQGTAVQPDSAYRWLHESATKRDPLGMTELGLAYQNGVGTRPNKGLAVHWYEAAANEKHVAEAMRRLGSLYRDGQNYAAALRSYRNAVAAGSADARVDAGWMYENGLGISQDLDEARCQYSRAADAREPRGMVAMGRIYQDSVGVRGDFAKAMEWYRKAAGAGSAEAMNRIGDMYKNGWGVPQSDSAAGWWYRRARDTGSMLGAANLAAMGAN